MDKAKNASETLTSRRGNCAQSVFTAFSEDYGLDKDKAYCIAQSFGGGMHINSVCGAVTGAYMALGLANPLSKDDPKQSMDTFNAMMTEFNRRFKELHGALNCTELLGYECDGRSYPSPRKGIIRHQMPGLCRRCGEDSGKPAKNFPKIEATSKNHTPS